MPNHFRRSETGEGGKSSIKSWRGFFLTSFTLAIILFASGCTPQRKTVFWIGVRNSSDHRPTQSFFDDQSIRFMAKHGSLVVINLWPEGPEPPLKPSVRRDYDLRHIVKRFHQWNPKLPVLLYGQSSQWLMRGYEHGSMSGLILGGCSDGTSDDTIRNYLLELPGLPPITGAEEGSNDQLSIPALSPGCGETPPGWRTTDDTPWPKTTPWARWQHFLDVRNPEFHAYLADRLQWFYENSGAGGILFDATFPSPKNSPRNLLAYCKRARDLEAAGASGTEVEGANDFCNEYPRALREMYETLKRELRGQHVFFNGGLSYSQQLERDLNPDFDSCNDTEMNPRRTATESDRSILEAEDLLNESDGASIEFFGNNPDLLYFELIIKTYLNLLQERSDKQILVFGRSKDQFEYQHYAEDYQWQRYLYGSYLLAKNEKSRFKYLASFLNVPVKSPRILRSGGMDVYADWQLDFGEPLALAPYHEEGSLFIREFENGIVLVNPHNVSRNMINQCNNTPERRERTRIKERVPLTYTLDRPMFTSEKVRIEGSVTLVPGQAKFFFYRKPSYREMMSIDFELWGDPNDGEASSDSEEGEAIVWTPAGRWTEMRTEERDRRRNQYLRINAIPETAFSEFRGEEPTGPLEPHLYWEHDILLDAIRPFKGTSNDAPDFTRPDLEMQIRSSDPGLKLFLVAEVDDVSPSSARGKYITSIQSSPLRTELNSGVLSSGDGSASDRSSRTKFKKAGIELGEDLIISTEVPNSQWRIVDGDKSYTVMRTCTDIFPVYVNDPNPEDGVSFPEIGKNNFLIIEATPSPSLTATPCPGYASFDCTLTMTYRSREDVCWPYLHHQKKWASDGNWHDFQMDGKEIVDGTGRFKFRRWTHMRVIGSADIDDISIKRISDSR